MPPAALEDILVLEVAHYVTGPYTAMLLADLGARVLKIEEPPQGDPFRGWGQPQMAGYTPTFWSVNRGKKSVRLNLRTETGRLLFRRLAEKADVIVENFRPGVMAKMGLDYESLRHLNPRLVYCSISGFGQDGPYGDRPGYDTIGQAMGGLLSLLTDLESPRPVGISLADHITGVFACYGVLAALYARQRTGRGQKVETSLLQSVVSFVQEASARYLASGQVPGRESRVHMAQVYAFVAGDGRPFVIHLSSPQKFWEGLVRALGRPELLKDPRFKGREDRIQNYSALQKILEPIFRTAPREEWLKRLHKEDVPCAPIYTLDEVFSDPQVKHLGLEVTLPHPQKGEVRLSGNPVVLQDTPVQYRLPPPLFGEHTEEVLTQELGLSVQDVERLQQEGVI